MIDHTILSEKNECMALNVLHQWQKFPICGTALVPEHVERRPLFNASRPGLEQVFTRFSKISTNFMIISCTKLPKKLSERYAINNFSFLL